MPTDALVQLSINTLRFLAVDAIQKASSGHPGLPMGAAPMAYVLWMRHLRHNPADPHWPDRDRFVLSAGHGSMLLYGLLHLTGYDLDISDLKQFRQWGSRTPGHPEFGVTPGVEATTGPLGQGLANAVGMAIAEAHLAARYNRPGHTVLDHRTYCLVGDGDLMEGVAFEASALAGHLGLSRLTVLYDSNRISLSGSTGLAFSEDVGARFHAAGWLVLRVDDGNDLESIDRALCAARAQDRQPSIIIVSTVIGYGAPNKQGTFGVHGAPLGAEEVAAAKANLGWPTEPAFLVPEEVRAHMGEALGRGREAQRDWEARLQAYTVEQLELAAEFRRVMEGRLPDGWEARLPELAEGKGMATRKASEAVLQALTSAVPELVGGAADLNPSTFTWLKGAGDLQSPGRGTDGVQGAVGGSWDYAGRNIHFGVREHAMGAIANGIALHGGLIPFTGTFFTFSDYMRPPIRLAAMSGLRVVFVFTHDSIGVGEDGPTHQPVEQIMALRVIPGLRVIRPADAAETLEAWRAAVAHASGPTAIVLTRQNVPDLDRARCAPAAGLQRGGYILWESGPGVPDLILIGTGSETGLALRAGRLLGGQGVRTRVVSLPSWDIFDAQPADYREGVLPPAVMARVAVEAGTPIGWERYVGLAGSVIGVQGFGASAPQEVLFRRHGFVVEGIAAAARQVLERGGSCSMGSEQS